MAGAACPRQMIEVGGRRVCVFRHGEEDAAGLALVLIHGAGGTYLHWPPRLRRLAGTRVFAPDLPGHGRSDGPGSTTVEEYAGSVEALTDALGLERYIVGGHSMGAAITLELARRCPERLVAMVIVGGAARLLVAPAILDGLRDDFESATVLITRLAYGPQASEHDRRKFLEGLRRNGPDVLRGDFLACHTFDITANVAALNIPALIVCGREDRMTPPSASEYLHANLASSSLRIVERAGHMVMIEQPAAVTAAVGEFVTQRQGADALTKTSSTKHAGM